MSYGGGHRLDDVTPVPEPDLREEAVMIFEEENAQIALEFTYARFQRLAAQGVHEVVVEPEQQEDEVDLTSSGEDTESEGERDDEDEDIARAQEALTYAEEALGRSEARAWRSPDMWHRHQDAQRALRHFQGAMEEAVALRRREEENRESFVRRTQRAADVIASATQPTATQPTPVQYVQFLPNTGKSVRARELDRASLTKEREDLEEQMERMEITEGVYLERMNALRDRYNRAPYGLALSTDASTLAGNNLTFDVRPRVVETDINRALIDRAWPPYIVDRAALDDDEPPNSEIPEVD